MAGGLASCYCLGYPVKLPSNAPAGPTLGPNAFPARGSLDRLPGAGWKAPRQRECAVAVRGQEDSQPGEAAERMPWAIGVE